MKYHINPSTGQAGLCKAQKRCRFGSLETHFATAEEARKNFEQEQEFLAAHPASQLLSPLWQPVKSMQDFSMQTAELYSETKALWQTLTPEEQSALHNYAFSSSKEINYFLRHDTLLKEDAPVIAKLAAEVKSAFTKAPSKQQRVWRVEHLRNGETVEAFIQRHQQGSTFEEKGVLSTTVSSDTAVWLARRDKKGQTPILLEIVTEKGLPLQHSEKPSSSRIQSLENELLLPPNSKFTTVAATDRRKIVFGEDQRVMADYESHFGYAQHDKFAEGKGVILPSVQLLRTDA